MIKFFPTSFLHSLSLNYFKNKIFKPIYMNYTAMFPYHGQKTFENLDDVLYLRMIIRNKSHIYLPIHMALKINKY